MVDVTNKLAGKVLQKAFENSQTQNQPGVNGESPFQDMLNSMKEDVNFAEILGVTDNKIMPNGKAQTMSAESISFKGSEEGFARFENSTGEKFMNMLSDFNQQQTQMDGLINEVMYGGKKFSNQELLAIQAHVFHVAQMTELTVKSVELAVSSFKGVMNTQIQ